MAEVTVSQITSFVKENKPIHIDFIDEQTPVVSSLDVARHFQKKPKHVLEDIRKIISICPESFTGPNFRLSEYTDSTGRKLPYYLLTRDAFTLLVMGFTGSAALHWKLKYIEVFNALEAGIRSNIRTDALDEALSLPVMQAERKAGHLAGLKEGQKFSKKRDGLYLLRRALNYRKKGLNQRESAVLLGVSHQRVSDLLARAREMGVAV